MKRRTLVAGMAAVMATPLAVRAQQARKVSRIGIVSPGGPSPALAAFEQALPRYGWLPGQNIVIEARHARGDLARIPSFVAELLRLPVDLLLVSSTALPAAIAATRTVPIVMAFAVDDPVAAGWVVSLARPGGNVTGITLYAPELTAKRLEILKSFVTDIKRVAILSWRGPGSLGQLNAAKAAAASLGLEHHVVAVADASEYEGGFAAMKRVGADAVLVLSSASFFAERRRIADLALKHRLPVMAPFREVADAGGLLAYGPSIVALWRDRLPIYVDRVLRGSRPAELPIEQPTTFELVINVRTAKALGLAIPPSLLQRADEVID
jgi:putative tryptophan/tyrosine transport system substrate-binding protein